MSATTTSHRPELHDLLAEFATHDAPLVVSGYL